VRATRALIADEKIRDRVEQHADHGESNHPRKPTRLNAKTLQRTGQDHGKKAKRTNPAISRAMPSKNGARRRIASLPHAGQ
jgi:hypothetical protein